MHLVRVDGGTRPEGPTCHGSRGIGLYVLLIFSGGLAGGSTALGLPRRWTLFYEHTLLPLLNPSG